MTKKIRSHYKAPIRQLGDNIEGYVLDEVDGKTLPYGEVKCVLSKRGFANVLGLKGGSGAVSKSLNSKDKKGNYILNLNSHRYPWLVL